MIVGTGMDLVELQRIKRIYDKYGYKFLKRILTASEIEKSPINIIPYIAGRFAGKEAAVKSLGCGFNHGITPLQIEIFNDNLGRPYLHFSGEALALSKNLQVDSIHITISHERGIAAAIVILER